jgi:hypothetical protein
MLTSGELNEMRDVTRQVLPGTAILMAPTNVPDGQGGFSLAYSAIGTVAARLAPDDRSREGEQTVGDRNAEVANWVCTFAHDVNIEANYRIVYLGHTYEVSLPLHWDPWEIARRVRVVEVD